jgi:hypothetical protein
MDDQPTPVAACAICGKPFDKDAGEVLITQAQNAVHAQCAERLAA